MLEISCNELCNVYDRINMIKLTIYENQWEDFYNIHKSKELNKNKEKKNNLKSV